MPTSLHRVAALSRHALLLTLLSASGCSANTTTAPVNGDPYAPKPPIGVPTVRWDTTEMTIKGKKFAIEVAEKDEQIQRGLMYRDALKDDHGMLFVFPVPTVTQFWMKNTRIPLDIIFLDATGKVLVIHQRKPFDETGMGPDSPAQYVIELNVGAAAKLGLKAGDTVEIPKKYLKTAAAPSDK